MKSILVVEDDPKIAKALGIRLSTAGYEVIHAPDAMLGTKMAVKHQPDLMLLDISMPGGNGFQVAERIQKNHLLPKEIKFIFITAGKQPDLRKKAMELDAAAFFEKPYDADELLAAIRQALPEPMELDSSDHPTAA